MSDFQRFIHPKRHDPYENLRIDPIEGDKKQKDQPYTGLPSNPSLSLAFAALTACLKQIFNPLTTSDHSLQLFFRPEQLLERVLELKSLFEQLADQDVSHESSYTERLSSVWHNLLQDCNSILSYSNAPPEYARQALQFLQQLTHYPPHEDHSLGYYLEAGMGKDWAPFPFMEMLEELHRGCKTDPQHAPLIQWIVALTEILNAQNDSMD